MPRKYKLNILAQFRNVKPLPSKGSINCRLFLTAALLISMGTGSLATAYAEDTNALAIYNAHYLTNLLHSVDASRLNYMTAQIANTIQRPAHNQPVWLLNSTTETIMYYQGQPSFATQPAAMLVDDRGIRFGQQALDNAKKSKSGWVTLVLGGVTYKAYCLSQHPTVVCSLAM